MRIFETRKFEKLRKKLNSVIEKEALINAIKVIVENPQEGKKLKGELKGLQRYRYSVQGQERRLIYKVEKDTINLLSFGHRSLSDLGGRSEGTSF